MSKPLISVVIPAFRCKNTLREAIDSALAQCVDLEILVLNDCPQENLDEIMVAYSGDSRVRYMKNECNLGAGETRNRGVMLSRGKYVAFLDADDRWAPGKLIKQVAALEHTGYVLCCTARAMMDIDGRLTGRIIPVKETITYSDLLKHNSINCSSVLLPTEIAKEFPMQHEDSHEDYIMWLKILRKYGPACGINEPLLQYRVSHSGKSGSKLQSAKMTFMVYRYMEFGLIQSLACFFSYALHGIRKHWLK